MQRLHYRFGIVLTLIIVTLGFQLAAPDGNVARLISVTLQAGTLVAAVIASRAHPWVIRLSVLVALAGVAAAVATLVGTSEFSRGGAGAVALVYILLTPPALVLGLRKHFGEAGGVTLQTMFGVLCLYLLVGLLFSFAYGAVDFYSDTPFFSTGVDERGDFLYFSFTTLTTVGYGDLVAATDVGRSLAITEALVGQIYLVTVVAVIVGNLRPAGRRRASG
ncbi:MAG: potassium channel family protein [Solirubrobacterales bacterium]